MLPGNLGADDIVLLEPVYTLPAEYGMTVCRVQRVRDAFLAAKGLPPLCGFQSTMFPEIQLECCQREAADPVEQAAES